MTIHETKFPELGYACLEAGCWRFASRQAARTSGRVVRCVGPVYPTKEALLKDLQRYAWESWGLGSPPSLTREGFYHSLAALIGEANNADAEGSDLPPRFANQGHGENLGVYGHLVAVMEALKPGAYGEWRDDGAWPHFDPAPCSHKFRPGDRVMMVYPAGWEYHVGLDNSRNVVDQHNPYYVVCWDVDGFGDGWRESHLHTTDK